MADPEQQLLLGLVRFALDLAVAVGIAFALILAASFALTALM